MTHLYSHRPTFRGRPGILALSCAAVLALIAPAGTAMAQEALPPLPGQSVAPAAPLSALPQVIQPAPTPPSTQLSAQPQTQTLQPLPGLPPLPGPTGPQPLDPALVAERDQLYATYQALQARLQKAQTADTPAQPQTLEAIEQATSRLQKAEFSAQLAAWTESSANTLLQTINGRPLNGVTPLPAGTQIAPRFVKMRLATTSYDRPSTEEGTPLYTLQQGAAILELALTQGGAWAFVWVPNNGYSYVLQSLVSPLEEE